MPETSDFCSRYTPANVASWGSDVAPCVRCGRDAQPHIVADIKARPQRKREERRLRVHVPKRPADERIPPEVLARRTDPVFGRIYRRARLVCPTPTCGGYMVVRGRADRRFKFAGCSTYNETHCKATLGSWEYVERKSAAVEDLIAARTPRYAVIFVTPKPRVPKNAA